MQERVLSRLIRLILQLFSIGWTSRASQSIDSGQTDAPCERLQFIHSITKLFVDNAKMFVNRFISKFFLYCNQAGDPSLVSR